MPFSTIKSVTSAGIVKSDDGAVITEVVKVVMTVTVVDDLGLPVGSKAFEIGIYKGDLEIDAVNVTGAELLALCTDEYPDEIVKFEREALYEFTPLEWIIL